MTKFFELWHYKINEGTTPDKGDAWQDAKDLGIYSTEKNARAALARRRDEPGFRQWPHGFRVESIPVDPDFPPVAIAQAGLLFQVWHFDIGPDDEADTEEPQQYPRRLGAFSSDERAKRAIARYREKQEFRHFPNGFRTYPRRVDVDHWEGGFVSWDEA